MAKDPLDVNGIRDLVQGLVNRRNVGGGDPQPVPDKAQLQEVLRGAMRLAKERLEPEQQEVVAQLMQSLLQRLKE